MFTKTVRWFPASKFRDLDRICTRHSKDRIATLASVCSCRATRGCRLTKTKCVITNFLRLRTRQILFRESLIHGAESEASTDVHSSRNFTRRRTALEQVQECAQTDNHLRQQQTMEALWMRDDKRRQVYVKKRRLFIMLFVNCQSSLSCLPGQKSS